MRFHYVAFQPDGKIVEGSVEAATSAEVLSFLGRNNLRPVSVEAAGQEERAKSRKFFGQKITLVDKVFLTKYLALMLRVGTDLFRAVDILIADFEKPIVKAFMGEVRSGLE